MAKSKLIKDKDGREVSTEYIDPHILERDEFVSKMVEESRKLNIQLAGFKDKTRQLIKKYLNDAAEKYGEKWQGNTILYNFDQTMAIDVSISKYLTMDERMNIAKAKIDSCLKRWSKGANANLIVAVNSAFHVDSKGKVQTKKVLELRSYTIKHEVEWDEAMDLISDSIVVASTKQYINFKHKDSDGVWHTVKLNYSSI